MENLPSAFTVHRQKAWWPIRTENKGWVWFRQLLVYDYSVLTAHGMIYGRKYYAEVE